LTAAFLTLCVAGCGPDDPLAPNFQVNKRTLSAPSNATATAISSSEIAVTWQDNSGNEDGFEVYVGSTPAGTFSLWTTTGPNATSTGFSGIAAEQQYCVEVRAFTARGKSRTYSEFSNTACASTALPPSAPLGTATMPLPGNAVLVSWTDNSNNETGFRLERSLDHGSTWTLDATTPPWPTYFRTAGAPGEQQVCFRVIAFNRHGDSPTSSTACTVLPTPPTDLTATGVAVPAINLTWTDNSNVEDGYEVLRSPVEVDYYTYVVIATLPPNSIAYHDAGVSANTRYWYYVRAKKDGGFTNQSNTASAIAATTLPTAPSGLDAVPVGSSAISMSWLDNSGNEDGFRIERSVDGGTNWQLAAAIGPERTWFRDDARTSDQRLCYRVLAFNGLGVSGPSNTDCATPPAAPTGLVATTAPDLAIDLTWTDNSSVEDGYDVFRQYCDYSYWEPYCYYVIMANLGPDATSYHDAGLNPGEAYTYVVSARKDGGSSDPSNEAWAFSTLPPAAPSNLTASAVSPTEISLSWTDNASDEQLFAIQGCRGDEAACVDLEFYIVGISGWADANATTFRDVDVQPGTTYTYRIRAYNGQYSAPSNAATVVTPP
jgi:hypothetical protein